MISGGRDSTAMVEKMLQEGRDLDYIIFTDTEQEFGFMYEYLDKFNDRLKSVYGKEITYLKPKSKFEDWAFGKVTRGDRKGMTRGLPMITVVCYWKRESKVYPFDRFIKENNITEYTQYIGYTYSERKRAVVKDTRQSFPLIDYKMCEADVDRLLESIDMVNPLYNHFSRTGCAMCPYQSERSMYILWKNYKDTWEYMKNIENKLLNMDSVVNKTWKIGVTIQELEDSFIENKKSFSDVPDKACECAI